MALGHRSLERRKNWLDCTIYVRVFVSLCQLLLHVGGKDGEVDD